MATVPSNFTCNTCAVAFDTSEAQRSHMRHPWHLYNLQRRIASLPATSEAQYQDLIPTLPAPTPAQPTDEELPLLLDVPSTTDACQSGEVDQSPSRPPATHCLFCPNICTSFTHNLEHMHVQHGLFIPSPDAIIDLETFIAYLGIVIFNWHECLYCGQAKRSVEAVQTHMRDKGHCMINPVDSKELLEFWEFSDDEDDDSRDVKQGESSADKRILDDEKKKQPAAPPKQQPVHVTPTELRLPSGIIIASRSESPRPSLIATRAETKRIRARAVAAQAVQARRNFIPEIDTSEAPPEGEAQQSSPHPPMPPQQDRRITRHAEIGLAGVPEQQRKALARVEKKMVRREAVAREARRWAVEKVANRQKYYKPDDPGRTND